jgi:hypothetical protein
VRLVFWGWRVWDWAFEWVGVLWIVYLYTPEFLSAFVFCFWGRREWDGFWQAVVAERTCEERGGEVDGVA